MSTSHINDHKLGRKGVGRRGDVNKFHMVAVEKIGNKIATLEAVDSADLAAMQQACSSVLNELRLIGH